MSLTKRTFVAPGLAAAALVLAAGTAVADDRDRDNDHDNDRLTLSVRLSGFGEVPTVSTTGSGKFTAEMDPVTGNIDYELSYDGLQGKVTQSHIHIGPPQNNGGISIWLCQTTTNPAPVTTPATIVPTCPAPSGTVTGTITAAHVIGPTGQLVTAGQLDEVLAAIRAGLAYVNVHTGPNTAPVSPGVPSGEIRGQIRSHSH
jgi:hypothetical protein